MPPPYKSIPFNKQNNNDKNLACHFCLNSFNGSSGKSPQSLMWHTDAPSQPLLGPQLLSLPLFPFRDTPGSLCLVPFMLCVLLFPLSSNLLLSLIEASFPHSLVWPTPIPLSGLRWNFSTPRRPHLPLHWGVLPHTPTHAQAHVLLQVPCISVINPSTRLSSLRRACGSRRVETVICHIHTGM